MVERGDSIERESVFLNVSSSVYDFNDKTERDSKRRVLTVSLKQWLSNSQTLVKAVNTFPLEHHFFFRTEGLSNVRYQSTMTNINCTATVECTCNVVVFLLNTFLRRLFTFDNG